MNFEYCVLTVYYLKKLRQCLRDNPKIGVVTVGYAKLCAFTNWPN